MNVLCTETSRARVAVWIAALLVTLGLVGSLHGQELDQVLAHVSDETTVLVRIDPTAFDAFINTTGQDKQEVEETVLQHRLKKAKEIHGDAPVWLTVGFPQVPLSIQILVRDPDDKRVETLKQLWDFPPRYAEPSVTIGKLSDPKSKNSVAPSRLAKWKKLMAKVDAKQAGVQFACLPPAHLYDTYRELLTTLPDNLGGGPITLLTEGLQSVSGTFDLKTGELQSSLESTSPSAATAVAERLTELVKLEQLLTKVADPKSDTAKQIKPLLQQLDRSVFQSNESQVRWSIPANENWQASKMLELAIGPAFNRSAMARLRNLSLGILNYESAMQQLPPPADSRGPDGPTGLSWRVHILPFIGENELFQRFALDEPWDSPANVKLVAQMPDIYSEYGSVLFSPAKSKPGYTTVVAPIGENTVLGASKKVTFRSMVDGSSNTILLVIVKDSLAVPWTAPQGYAFDPDQPAAGLKFINGRTPTAFCDSSCMELVVENDWIALFEMNDGGVTKPK